MVNDKLTFFLASGSPRRKEMIDWLGIPYSIRTTAIDESSSIEDPALKSEDIAKQKGTIAPHRPLCEPQPARDALNLGIGINEIAESCVLDI